MVVAHDGQHALDILEHNDFDIVLMDIQMPVMDGLQATRKIRLQQRLAHLPIVAMSAGVTFSEREKCLAVGMADFIAKPIDPLLMFDIIAKVVSKAHPSLATEIALDPLASVQDGQSILNLPGFDAKRLQVLETLMKDREKVLQGIQQFEESFVDIEQEVSAWLAQDNHAAACARLHALKGVAGNWGAIELAALTDQLENILKQGGDPTIEFQQFCVAWQVIRNTMQNLPTLTDLTNLSTDKNTFNHDLLTLGELLTDNKLVPINLLDSLTASAPEQQTELIMRLRKVINIYDYDKALLILRELQ